MSESIFETFTDERGNISVRISQEVQVLTREEANCIEAEYRRMQTENAKLRELVRVFYHCTTSGECDECPVNGGGAVHLMPDTICDTMHDRMRELGVDDHEQAYEK